MFHKLARLLRIGYRDRFHSRGQLPCKFKEVFIEERIGLVQQGFTNMAAVTSLPPYGRSRPLLTRNSSAHAIHDVARATSCVSSAHTESKLSVTPDFFAFLI